MPELQLLVLAAAGAGGAQARFLTPVEEARLFGELAKIGTVDHEFAITLVDTGGRCGEIFALTPSQLDFEASVPDKAGQPVTIGTITIKGSKTDATRTIFMTKRVRAILWARRHNARLFQDLNKWTWQDHWNKAKRLAGFEHDPLIVPHILRHTCASRIVQGGLGLKLAQTQLGHASPVMTGRYAHLDVNALSRVVQTLELGGRCE